MKVHNIQRITIVFCALFLSTFGHDYLKAHQASRAHIQHSNRHHHLISHLQHRAHDSQQVCNWECLPSNSDDDQNLQILLNGDLVGVYNLKESVALVVDVKHKIGAVFNGTTGGVVLINVQTNKGYDLPSGVWLVSKQPFDQFFNNLATLETIWNQAQKNGSGFDIKSIPDSALHHIAQVFQFLGVEIAATVRNSLKETIKLFVKYTKDLIEHLQGLEGLGKLSVRLHGDLEWLVNTLNGIKEFITRVPGGLKYLLDQGIKLRLEVIFKAKSGIEAFVNLLEDIGSQVNLAPIFKDALNNPGDVLGFIDHLGGDVSVGINGFFKVLYKLIGVHNGKISVDDLLETLIRFSGSRSCDFAQIRKHVQQILKLINEQIKKYNTDDEWSTLKMFLEKLLDPKSVAIGGISVAELLRNLSSVGQESPIKIVVKVLWTIRLSVKVQQTIPQLVLTILKQLNSQPGLQVLIKLIPGLKLKYSPTGEIDVVGTIKDQLNLQNLLPFLNDLPKLLKRIPIINNVVKAIEDALQEVSHGEYNFDDLIKCSGAAKITQDIRIWLKNFLHIKPIGLPPHGLGPVIPRPGGLDGDHKDDNSGEDANNSDKDDNNSDGHIHPTGPITLPPLGHGPVISHLGGLVGDNKDDNSGKADNNPDKGDNSGDNSAKTDGHIGSIIAPHPGPTDSDKQGDNSGKDANNSDKDDNNSGENSAKGASNSGNNLGKVGVFGAQKHHGGHGGGVGISWHHHGRKNAPIHAESKHHQVKERHNQVRH